MTQLKRMAGYSWSTNCFVSFFVCQSRILAVFSIYRAEYSAFWKCVQAGGMYLFTQLCKMLVLATFFPTTEVASGGLDVIGVSCTPQQRSPQVVLML